MKGWQIFRHSVRLVLANLGMALRLSLALYLVQAAVQIYERTQLPGDIGAQLEPGTALMLLVLSLIAIVASLWIAVGWHRYVLLGEEPVGFVPPWRGAGILRYLGRSILVGLAVALALAVVMVAIGPLAAGVPGLAVPVTFAAIGVAAAVFFRFCATLPAAATDAPLTFGEAWAATRGQTGTILSLALLVVGASLLISLPSIVSGGANPVIDTVYGVVVGWFATMIGVSVITTIYGHFVEGRPID